MPISSEQATTVPLSEQVCNPNTLPKTPTTGANNFAPVIFTKKHKLTINTTTKKQKTKQNNSGTKKNDSGIKKNEYGMVKNEYGTGVLHCGI